MQTGTPIRRRLYGIPHPLKTGCPLPLKSMDLIRRLFSGSSKPALPAAKLETFTIQYPNGKTPIAVRTPRNADPELVVEALHLTRPVPTIFISGGAGGMDMSSQNMTRTTIEDGLLRFLQEHGISLIDGGTSTGVMSLIGLARQRRNYTFPLIGIAPEHLVYYPNHSPKQRLADLDAFHSHFVLTEGEEFGAESAMILGVARALSGKGAKKLLGFVINGGEIVRKEIHRVSTEHPEIPLLVLEGSGRFADELSAAKKSGTSTDPQIREILREGNLHFISIKAGADTLRRWLEAYFGY